LLTVDQKGLLKKLSVWDRSDGASTRSSHRPPDYNIVELGWVNEESVFPRMFSACDVFLMPSTAEAFGLMALEAMMASRPVICFEGTALPGVTHAPDCGIAVPMGDSLALRAAIDLFSDDPQEAQRRGRLGRSLAEEHYTYDRYLDAMASLYREVLDRPR
jgi:glycosyltransferase involved in cell wall biosynthesis